MIHIRHSPSIQIYITYLRQQFGLFLSHIIEEKSLTN